MKIRFNFINIYGGFYFTPYIEWNHCVKILCFGWFNLCFHISFEKDKKDKIYLKSL